MLTHKTFSNLFSISPSRSRRSANRFITEPAQVLETRRLLTNTAPSISDLTTDNAIVTGVAQDDGSGGLSVTLSFDGYSQEISLFAGESFSFDLVGEIPENTVVTATLTITEVFDYEETGEGEPLSSSQTIQIAGVTIDPVDISWIDSSNSGLVYGAINPDDVSNFATASVMYREVGDTNWSFGVEPEPDGSFDFMVSEADGEKDFEFVVMVSGESTDVFGAIVTINDLGESQEEGGEAAGYDGGYDGGYGTTTYVNQGDGDDDDNDVDDYFGGGWAGLV